MQEDINRIKSTNLGHLGLKIQKTSNALSFLETFVTHKLHDPSTKLSNDPSICQRCDKMSIRLKKYHQQLHSLKEMFISFNITQLVNTFQKQCEESIRETAKYLSTQMAAKNRIQASHTVPTHSMQTDTSTLDIQGWLELRTNPTPKTLQSTPIQTDPFFFESLTPNPRLPPNETKHIELNRCMFNHNPLKSEETQMSESVADITKLTVKENLCNNAAFSKGNPSYSKGNSSFSKDNPRSKSNMALTLASRKASLQDNKHLKQKEFMKLAYNNYIESGRARQLDLAEIDTKARVKNKADKAKPSLIHLGGQEGNLSNMSRYK